MKVFLLRMCLRTASGHGRSSSTPEPRWPGHRSATPVMVLKWNHLLSMRFASRSRKDRVLWSSSLQDEIRAQLHRVLWTNPERLGGVQLDRLQFQWLSTGSLTTPPQRCISGRSNG